MTITPKIAQFLAMSTMVFLMTFIIVLISTLLNFGFDESFAFRFLRGWGLSFALALPLVMFLMPRLQKLFQNFTKKG